MELYLLLLASVLFGDTLLLMIILHLGIGKRGKKNK